RQGSGAAPSGVPGSTSCRIDARTDLGRRGRAARALRDDGCMSATVASHELYTKHADTLHRALAAITDRGYWSAFPESPSPRVYGETAAPDGEAAFRAYLGADFPLDQPGADGRVATESSPYGVPLGVRYPHVSPDALIAAATAALPAWRDAGPDTRTGVCLEI